MDEYTCLREWSRKKKLTISDLIKCDERYHRYLNRISCWKDSDGNDYSYIQQKVYEFVNIENTFSNIEYKHKIMKYIDGEILVMMSSVLMREMEV